MIRPNWLSVCRRTSDAGDGCSTPVPERARIVVSIRMIWHTIRNMGAAALVNASYILPPTPAAGADHIWVVDHIAIPPDDAEGSNDRGSIRWQCSRSCRRRRAQSSLVSSWYCLIARLCPHKWIASIQALCGERLYLGVARVGWRLSSDAWVDQRQRGKITDDTIRFIRRCFDADDIVEETANHSVQARPKRPPIYVGGMSDAALKRRPRSAMADTNGD